MVASATGEVLQGETYLRPLMKQQGQPLVTPEPQTCFNYKLEGHRNKECSEDNGSHWNCAHVVKRWGTGRGSAMSLREEIEIPLQNWQAFLEGLPLYLRSA